jgi:hypothetical protein
MNEDSALSSSNREIFSVTYDGLLCHVKYTNMVIESRVAPGAFFRTIEPLMASYFLGLACIPVTKGCLSFLYQP